MVLPHHLRPLLGTSSVQRREVARKFPRNRGSSLHNSHSVTALLIIRPCLWGVHHLLCSCATTIVVRERHSISSISSYLRLCTLLDNQTISIYCSIPKVSGYNMLLRLPRLPMLQCCWSYQYSFIGHTRTLKKPRASSPTTYAQVLLLNESHGIHASQLQTTHCLTTALSRWENSKFEFAVKLGNYDTAVTLETLNLSLR